MAYFHDSVTFGEQVYFIDGDKKKVIVDETGHFVHFPGVIHGDWERHITVGADLENPCIRFRTSFETNGDGYRCYWELQPDGRYWGDDDGFGAEHGSELILCADMDKNGDFVTPFQIYKIGIRYVIG